jgi:serine/threonine-protein kinase
MAVIYRAVDEMLGRTVAIKVMRPSLTNDPQFIQRFQNEARSIANMSHPNIVTVYDVGSDGNMHYIVMEFVEGQDLKKVIKSQGALSIERTLNLAIQICAGIGFAHRSNFVHADIKPQNVLLTRDDIVKITDFGIAQALSDSQQLYPPTRQERQSVVWGSPHYFAPEQAQGERPSPASDVYAIGIVMFEMLTGRLPFTGSNQQELAMAHIRERVPLVTEYNPSVPENLARIVQKVMSKEPTARYRTADQLGHILISYRDRGRQNTIPTNPPVDNIPQAPTENQSAPNSVYAPDSNLQTPSAPITQRYNVVPDAPKIDSPQYQPSIPSAQADSRPIRAQPYSPANVQNSASNSNLYRPPTQFERPQRSAWPMDPVTVTLALLALMAVACLIPLYIVALQAR